MDSVETLGAPITAEAPFKGMSINCRSCHFVDDLLTASGGGMRTYADFAQRSPIPARADGKMADSSFTLRRLSSVQLNSQV